MLRVSQHLLQSSDRHCSIAPDGCTVVESCHDQESMRGSVYVAEHEVIHLRSGRIILQTGAETVEIGPGETGRGASLAFYESGWLCFSGA
jgi:heterodisulfide reductase subunit A-like polyferredoxin